MAQLETQHQRLSFDAFLAWEQRQQRKHELVDGVPVAMAGAAEAHNIIAGNVFAFFFSKLRGGPCRPFASDMLVRTGNDNARYPDVTIDCGKRDPANLVASRPVVVVEVLSPNTQREDRTLKLADYNATASIAHYVLVEPSEPLVDVYDRGPHGDFSLHAREFRGLEGEIALPAAALSLPMAEIYEGLALSAAES